jgi:hypothetical protein
MTKTDLSLVLSVLGILPAINVSAPVALAALVAYLVGGAG